MATGAGGGLPIRAFSHQSTNDLVFHLVRPLLGPGARVLDLGAGEGWFSRAVGDHVGATMGVPPATVLAACDVSPANYRYAEVRCDCIAADGVLPYADASFDAVCCLEVLEHVEDQFAFCREVMRVLKVGGTAILSTPNVLNMNSRVRQFQTGFATLFNPLSLSGADSLHTSGHIHPVSYYYLALALHRAGAAGITVRYDRRKRSAVALLALLWPFVLLGSLGLRRKLRRRDPEVLRENAPLLREMQSVGMLTSRSVVVCARRGAPYRGDHDATAGSR